MNLLHAITLLLLPVTPAAIADDGPPVLGRFVQEITGLQRPVAAAPDSDGTFIVVDRGLDSVFRCRAGVPEAVPIRLDESITLRGPSGVCVTPSDQIILSDTGNSRILALEPDGTLITQLVLPESCRPTSLAIGQSRLALIDRAAANIRVYEMDLSPRGLISGGRPIVVIGPGDDSVIEPVGIAFEPDGTLLVSDAHDHRIKRFDLEGRLQGSWGDRGNFPGLMNQPVGLAVAWGQVFVAESLSHRISVFDEAGEFLYQWGMHAVIPREGRGKIHYPAAIAIDAGSSTALVCEPFERRVQLFGPVTGDDPVPGSTLPQLRGLKNHFGVDCDSSGTMLVAWEPESSAMVTFDLSKATPIHITTTGWDGTAAHNFNRISTLAVDSESQRTWVCDQGNRRLQLWSMRREAGAGLKFDPLLGRLIKSIGLDTLAARVATHIKTADPTSTPNLLPFRVLDMKQLADGDLLFLESTNGLLVRIDDGFNILDVIRDTGDVGLSDSSQMDIDESGTIRLAQPTRQRVLALDEAGGVDGEIQIPPVDGVPSRPWGVLSMPDGRVIVTDAASDRIHVYGQDGSLYGTFGSTGIDDGQFHSPRGLAPYPGGLFVVLDHGNHRLQVMDPDGSWKMTFSLGRAYTRQRTGLELEKN